MNDHPKPAESERLTSPRAPMATAATKEAKARFDALALVLAGRRAFSADECVDLAEWILTGDYPEEDDQ